MLIIVRHGRTAANAKGLLQGRVDNPLDEEGSAQAHAIARALGSVDVVVSSPLLRARQTAEPLGAEVRIDERWIELDYGEWEARPVADVSPESWASWRSDPHFAPPGGESLAALNERVGAACADLIELAAEVDVAVFTHVSPIKSAIAWALGVDDEISWRMQVAQAQISRIIVRGGRPAVSSFNETAHLQR
jgi:broad specificity phosphatase PhoE